MLSRMLWSMLATLRVCRCLMWCRRFVCDFLDEVPDDVFCRLTPAAQVAFEPVNPTTGVKTRLRAQYYVMARHSMSLANALALFKVCAWQQSLSAVAFSWWTAPLSLQALLPLLVLLLARVMHVPVCCLHQVGEPRPLPFLVKVLCDVGRGLLSVRANRVVHMDLKAANVVLDWGGPDSRYARTTWNTPFTRLGEGVLVDGCRFPCLSQ